MSAIIKCNRSDRQEIKGILLDELGGMMESIKENVDSVSILEMDDGLSIYYPVGEIYGYASSYVEAIPYIFDNLKKKYPDIEVRGIAYEYEDISYATFGPLFYCESTDSKMTITYEWQECAQCGQIIKGEAIYNSSQKDFGEGNLMCLCTPTCMLEYSLNDRSTRLECNSSISEEDKEAYYEDEDEGILKNILWNRIVDSLNGEAYISDFSLNKSRIEAMLNMKGLDEEKKDVLKRILKLIE